MKTLTEREREFILKFLSNNGCGARNAKQLLGDNFSCQTIDDLNDMPDFKDYSKHQIAGFLASLQEKNVISIEDDRGYEYNAIGKKVKLPDLYWVNDSFLNDNIDLVF